MVAVRGAGVMLEGGLRSWPRPSEVPLRLPGTLLSPNPRVRLTRERGRDRSPGLRGAGSCWAPKKTAVLRPFVPVRLSHASLQTHKRARSRHRGRCAKAVWGVACLQGAL